MATNVQQGIKRITLEAKIIRAADGSEEDLGLVAEYNEDPKKRSKLLGGIKILSPALYQQYLNASRRA